MPNTYDIPDHDYGSTLSDITLYPGDVMIVSSGGMADGTTVNEDGILQVCSGGLIKTTTVNALGQMFVSSGGSAIGTVVNDLGSMPVSSGGTVTDTTVNAGGSMSIFSGGKANGQMTFASGAIISAFEGAVLAFDIIGLAPSGGPFLNDLSVVKGAPSFTLTVDKMLVSDGTYFLAGRATGFDPVITVLSPDGETIGTLSVGGGTQEIDELKYTLSLKESVLCVSVGEPEPPVEPDPPVTGPEEPLNNYLYDKKNKAAPVNKDVTESYGTILRAATGEVRLDQSGTVDSGGYHNHVGAGDEIDYAKITLEHGARVSLDLNATDASKFTLWSLTSSTDKKGVTTYKQKSLQATTLKKDKETGLYAARTKNLFLEAGVYYVSMQSTNAKKGGDAFYNAALNGDASAKNHAIVYSDGDNGKNNYLYDKKNKTLNPAESSFVKTEITSETTFVGLDSATLHTDEGGSIWKNFTGFGDDADFARIHLDYASKLSFTVTSADAAKFTVWELVKGTDKNDNPTYKQKSLQATTLKKDKETGLYGTTTDDLLLDAGDYYISMQSTNAKKGGTAYYDVRLGKRIIYNNGDNSDDGKYIKDLGDEGGIGDIGEIRSESESAIILDDWVGYGDEIDYKKFTVAAGTQLSFVAGATDAAVFTLYIMESSEKKGVTTYSLLPIQSVVLQELEQGSGKYYGGTSLFTFPKGGTFYFSMASTNAKKGGNAAYSVGISGYSAPSVSDSAEQAALSGAEEGGMTGGASGFDADDVLAGAGAGDFLTLSGADLDALRMSSACDPLASPIPVAPSGDLFDGLLA